MQEKRSDPITSAVIASEVGLCLGNGRSSVSHGAVIGFIEKLDEARLFLGKRAAKKPQEYLIIDDDQPLAAQACLKISLNVIYFSSHRECMES